MMPPDPTSATLLPVYLGVGAALFGLSMLRPRWWLFAALMVPLTLWLTCGPMDAQAWACVVAVWLLLALPWSLLWRIADGIRERRHPWADTPEGQAKIAHLRRVADGMNEETRQQWLRGDK